MPMFANPNFFVFIFESRVDQWSSLFHRNCSDLMLAALLDTCVPLLCSLMPHCVFLYPNIQFADFMKKICCQWGLGKNLKNIFSCQFEQDFEVSANTIPPFFVQRFPRKNRRRLLKWKTTTTICHAFFSTEMINITEG